MSPRRQFTRPDRSRDRLKNHLMPTILQLDGYRFFFYSNEGTEPPHIHVELGDARAKWWLTPVSLSWSEGFKPAQVRRMRTIVTEYRQQFLDAWNGYFN